MNDAPEKPVGSVLAKLDHDDSYGSLVPGQGGRSARGLRRIQVQDDRWDLGNRSSVLGMEPSDSALERLRDLVRDERARRTRSQQQLARQREETSRWRRRARKAEAAARFSIKLPSRRPTAIPSTGRPRAPIAYPGVRAGVHGVAEWWRQAVECVELAGLDEAGWAMLDLVVVEGDRVPAGLENWSAWEARQPLIAIRPDGDLLRLIQHVGPEVIIESEQLSPPVAHATSSERADIERRVAGGLSRTVASVVAPILREAGIELPDPVPGVTAVVVTNRPERLGHVLETLRRFDYPKLKVVVGTHGFTIDPEVLSRFEDGLGERLLVERLDEAWSLGRCLNHVMERTTTHVWAKIDDDDYYGPLYLDEAVIELQTTGADLAGKLTHFLYDTEGDRTYLMQPGNEHRETAYVPGPSFVGRRAAWERVPFAHRRARVDSTFVRGLRAVDLSIYSTSRFEFAVGRGAVDHTWQLDESHYEARGRLVREGFATEEIFLT